MKQKNGVRLWGPFFLMGWLAVLPLACSKTVISDPVAEPTKEPTQQPAPVASVGIGDQQPAEPQLLPADEKIVISVAQVEPEAWYKVCMTAIVSNVNSTAVTIGCNKDTNQIGKAIEIGANKGQCNKITLKAGVHRWQDNAGCVRHSVDPAKKANCCERGSLDPAKACAFPASPNWSRSTANTADNKTFKIFEAIKLNPPDADMHLKDSVRNALPSVVQQATEFMKKAGSQWLRVYFDDQDDDRFDKWAADKSSWQANGIDFDDYIVDIKGEGVSFTVEGSGVECAAQPAAANPPAVQPGGGSQSAPAGM